MKSLSSGCDCEGGPGNEKDTVLLDVNRSTGVAIITLKRGKFNQFTEEQTAKLNVVLTRCANLAEVKAVVITGAGRYYSAGADFASSVVPQMPSTMRAHITAYNESVFESYLSFPKPLIAAINGPAIGMAVTSAALTDCILASELATFHTPFAQLSLPPEGCSSVNFERLMGARGVEVMLTKGVKINAAEALAIGLAQEVLPPDQLLPRAIAKAGELARAYQNYVVQRPIIQQGLVHEYREVNRRESAALAKASLEAPFFRANMEKAKAGGNRAGEWTFWTLLMMEPLISRL